jgi:hypothetical protein
MKSLTKLLPCIIAGLPVAQAWVIDLGEYNNIYGDGNIIVIGFGNEARSSAVAIGGGNEARDSAVAIGDGNVSGAYGIALGYQNIVHTDYTDSTAVGSYNYIDYVGSGHAYGGYNYILGIHSSAFGENNSIGENAVGAIAFGAGNSVDAFNASVFGSGIVNATDGSTMIGPGNSAKVTILSSGNVGIGLGDTSPTEKLEVAGNIRLSGSITKAGGGTLVLPLSGTLTLPSGGGTLISSTGSQAITGATTVVTLGGSTAATQTKIVGATGNVGIGTASPTSSLTLASAASTTGLTFYNTADQITNYERVREYWSGNVFNIKQESAGTGSLRGMNIGAGGAETLALMGGYSTLTLQNASPNFSMVRTLVNAGTLSNHNATLNNSSGTSVVLSVTGSVNQSGTAGYTALLVNPTEYSRGSGAKNLADIQQGGTSRFKVTSTGDVGIGTGATAPAAKLDVNGTVQISGDVKIKNHAVIRVSAAGDIQMGSFTSGSNPEL